MKRSPIAVLLCVLLHCAATSEASVTVTKGEPARDQKTFDPKNPPPNVKPHLEGGFAAYTSSEFAVGWQTSFSVEELPAAADRSTRVRVTVRGLEVTLSLTTTLWLPTNADKRIVDHEQGHRTIAEHYYASADGRARRVAEAMVGQQVEGTGGTSEAAQQDASKQLQRQWQERFFNAVNQSSKGAQERFDKMTKHGTVLTLSVDDAVRRSIAEQDEADAKAKP